MDINGYSIVRARDIESLSFCVDDAIKEGWSIKGRSYHAEGWFFQTLVQYKETVINQHVVYTAGGGEV